MTITINAISGSSTANSYVTLAEANSYGETHIQSAIWSALDDEAKKAALVAATREIDSNVFSGRRKTEAQALAWPRYYIYDYDAFQVNDVPTKLKNATVELAIWNLTEDERLAGNFEVDYMDSVEIGPIKYKLKAGVGSGLPKVVLDMIAGIAPQVMVSATTSTGSKIMVI